MPEELQISFLYTNYRGQLSRRKAVPLRIAFESTDWHPEPQWILHAFDMDKKAERGFALKDCDFAAG
jgi:hypothetical protein